MSKKNKDKRKEKLLTKEVNILEVNKSCFKDCFYSFSHEHVFTLSFFLLPSPPQGPAPSPLLKPRNPASVSVEHCLSFDCFRFPSFDFRFDLFISLVSSPPAPAPLHTPFFLFNFTPFFYGFVFLSFSFYHSLCLSV